MKSYILISIFIIQLFITVRSRAIDGKEVSIVYKFDEELEKYKPRKNIEWDEEIEDEVDTSDNNIFKRLAFEDDEEFEASLNKFEEEGIEGIVDEVPNEFPHPDDKLVKRATISSSEYFRSQLSSFEKKIYDQLNAISNLTVLKRYDFTLTNLKSSKISVNNIKKYSSRGIGALVRDHPEYWWIKKYSIKFNKSENLITKLTVTITGLYKIDEVNSYKSKVESRVKSIASKAKAQGKKYPGKETYYSLLFIHDYIAQYIKYRDGQTYSYSMYGALVKNSCACEGYAESFATISRKINVPTICVTSSSHKWNYVYLKSNWYVVDVTYDDPTISGKIYESGETKNIKHKFFLIGRNTSVSDKKTYTTYSNRNLVSYLEFPGATGFSFPTLSKTAYTP